MLRTMTLTSGVVTAGADAVYALKLCIQHILRSEFKAKCVVAQRFVTKCA